MAHVAVGGFQHETNSFAPTRADYHAFEAGGGLPGISVGRLVRCSTAELGPWPGASSSRRSSTRRTRSRRSRRRSPRSGTARGRSTAWTRGMHFTGTNSPFAAFLDVAAREGAEVVTPIAAESWPSNKAARETFESLVRPVEEAVRRGCDAVLLDLHGAMVVEGADDAEGEILRRVRAIAPRVPVVVTFDYRTPTFPRRQDSRTRRMRHRLRKPIRTSTCTRREGSRARSLPARCDGEVAPIIAWGWLTASSLRSCGTPPRTDLAGDISPCPCGRAERPGTRGDALPAFPHADTPYTGVLRDRRGRRSRAGGRRGRCATPCCIAWDRREEYVFAPPPLADRGAGARARQGESGGPGAADRPLRQLRLGRRAGRDAVVAEILRQGLDGVAIAPIRDRRRSRRWSRPAWAERAVVLGGKTDMPSIGFAGEPLGVEGRVERVTDGESSITGPMYTGVNRTSAGPRCSIPAARRSSSPRGPRAVRPRCLPHAGIDPRK